MPYYLLEANNAPYYNGDSFYGLYDSIENAEAVKSAIEKEIVSRGGEDAIDEYPIDITEINVYNGKVDEKELKKLIQSLRDDNFFYPLSPTSLKEIEGLWEKMKVGLNKENE